MSSGDGSSSYSPGVSGGPRGGNCDDVNFQTTIRSPKQDVLAGVSPGDILDVVLDADGATIVLLTEEQLRVGSIMSGETATLIACLESGFEFVAQVRSKKGGAVTVHVRPKAGG